MSGPGPVDPVGIPVFTGDLALLDTKVTALSGHGTAIATAAGDVHRSFGGLSAFYKAPKRSSCSRRPPRSRRPGCL
ncbi:hypothetical protein OG842_18590 [Streptomyces sp. NBC_00376]|uniref:hypothetical protein n=1 Tax=unclassified Streptomyces TaxID=2593676 RepID=UPI002E1E09D0